MAALAVLAMASICQEVAFGGAGQDGFLSDGVKDSILQQVLDVRAAQHITPSTHKLCPVHGSFACLAYYSKTYLDMLHCVYNTHAQQ